MWKVRSHPPLALATLFLAAIAACSSSTSPSKSSTGGTTNPSGATKGDTINFSGTYNLASFTEDSTDGNSFSTPVDGSDGGTLVLTSTNYTLTWTGSFAASNGSTPLTGTYAAVDTSSAADRGTISLAGTQAQNGTYQFSTDTLTIALRQNNGTATDITVWVKQ